MMHGSEGYLTNGYETSDSSKDTMVMNHNLHRESPRSRRSVSQCSCTSRRSSVATYPSLTHPPLTSPVTPSYRTYSPPPAQLPALNNTVEMYVEPVVEDTGDRNNGWETHRVRLSRVPGYGFGIAVSGGRDNPHFASGDPAIAVSDVLRGGPAEDKLQVNDRIVSVNGTPLENVEYARAVQVLRESGAAVTLVVRRRAPAPPRTAPTHLRLALTKTAKKDDFGIVLGCKIYVKELSARAREQLNQAGQGLCEGDVLTRINNTPVTDNMTLKEARKLIEACKDRLNLVVTRELIREETVSNGNYNNYSSLDATPQSVYSSATPGGNEPISSTYSSSGQNLYVAGPVRGAAEHPPRPPPPRNDDYYVSRRQLYEEDNTNSQRTKPPSEPRLISFQKEGSVGVRVCGGNRSGVFVSGVQPASPAALQGLQPADKILKVNDMEMKGVTREEAVLFLLSLQERIDLIVQHSPEEYNAVASGQMAGDSFHVKTHFHYTEPTDGEMPFRSGDVFHVVDTLHNGTVGAWHVYRIGRNNQEVQKGIIPNKARAEELATAQFNATKKEMASGDGKNYFFRRRRSTHRRTKSLGKEQWEEVVVSGGISKFPAYERVALRPPGFVRPVVVLGAIADIARERLISEASDRFAAPKLDSTAEDGKTKTGIIRLSSIRSVMERGKHAALDITPSAVDRLNYAQFYPIVIFLKADSKHVIKQLRAGLPKSAHKSSKKLLEQSQQTERVWGHVFTHTITLSEANIHTWFSKLTELVHRTQQQQLWVSETKRSEPLSDDFLFSMSSSTENRLSYASSPESDLEVSPPPVPRLVKSSSDPSIATTQDNMDRDDDIKHMGEAVPPPYSQGGYGDSKYGFSMSHNGAAVNGGHNVPQQNHNMVSMSNENGPYHNPMAHSPPQSPLYGTVPELPPRSAPGRPAGGVPLPAPPPTRAAHALRHNVSNNRPSAQERLFGPSKESEGSPQQTRPTSMIVTQPTGQGSLDRHRNAVNTHNTYEGSPYEYNGGGGAIGGARLPPNAPDDLKVAPHISNKVDASPSSGLSRGQPPPPTDHGPLDYRSPTSDHNNYRSMPPEYRGPQVGRTPPAHTRGPSLPSSASNDTMKYSGRTHSMSGAEYVSRSGAGGGGQAPPYKPVPPPKPKHYRPPDTQNTRNGVMSPPAPPGGGPPHYMHQHSHSQPSHQPYPPHHRNQNYHQTGVYGVNAAQGQGYNGPVHHRAANLPPHTAHHIDLAGSREQRGSAFELYRKPQHMHNISSNDMNADEEAITPKTKKKLSKKPSFIKNAVLDLFRSKSKKVSRQKSLCESDRQQKPQIPVLRREQSDISDMSIHLRNTQIRNQMLQRSNSSCEKPILKPILKRENSFCDERNGITCTVREYDAKPIMQNLRRQSSMCEIETEPKVTPLLRRQNSLIEYNRRGIYGYNGYNITTKTDPIYQRQQPLKHEPFQFVKSTPPEPIYQSKDYHVYDPIPKPRRTYTSVYDTSTENSYVSHSEISDYSYENLYGKTAPVNSKVIELSYDVKNDYARQNPYIFKNGLGTNDLPINRQFTNNSTQEIYNESPYSNKEKLFKETTSENPYTTKEEMLRQRFSESPYGIKEDVAKQKTEGTRISNEPIYGKRTYDVSPNPVYSENPYSLRTERTLRTPVNMHGGITPWNKSMSEPPYSTRAEMLARLHQTTTPTQSRYEPNYSGAYYEPYRESRSNSEKRPASAECTYVSRQEILSQKAALLIKKDSLISHKPEDKLEIIKQRNQAKKDMIYQSRKEANECDAMKIREPLYVSKRELKESVIYESNQETKEILNQEKADRDSPYDLGDANHLCRRDLSANSQLVPGVKNESPFQEIDFSKLRMTDKKTDEKENDQEGLEVSTVLKGERVFTSMLHGKSNNISGDSIPVESLAYTHESTTSMDIQYISECSINFENKPQSTPYTSQDVEDTTSKATRSVTFCEEVVGNTPETSHDNSENISNTQNEITVINNQNAVEDASSSQNGIAGLQLNEVEPDAPNTTWGIFDSDGGILEDRQWGVSLIIPPKAIAPGIKQKVYFTVTDPRLSHRVGGPPMDMENGEAMLSPLVMCGPQGLVFLRPVTLRLPHCANAVPSLGLTIKATDTEAHLSTDWDQIHLPATTTLNTVAVKVDHF